MNAKAVLSTRGAALGLAMLSLAGCDAILQRFEEAPAESSKQPAASKPSEVDVSIDLPPGLDVSLDGETRGTTPIEPFRVSPGPHDVEVSSPCGAVKAKVDLSEGAAVVGQADFPDLAFATLHVTARDRDGNPLAPRVTLGEWKVPNDAKEPTVVPACKLRLTIRAEGLGALLEDIALENGKTYARDVTLLPGSDMVRLHGGPFRLGPPGPDLYDPDYEEPEPGDEVVGWPWIQQHDVVVGDFDIDRAEVTAQQFHECRKSGGCPVDPAHFFSSRGPSRQMERYCTSPTGDLKRTPREGKENHPINCVTHREAMQFCKWVGKRLPSEAEWEYAARSGQQHFVCPWGTPPGTKGPCDRSPQGPFRTRPVCSVDLNDSLQGVCDLIGGLDEFVTGSPVIHGTDEPSPCRDGSVRGGFFPFEHQGCMEDVQHSSIGFRCARGLKTLAEDKFE